MGTQAQKQKNFNGMSARHAREKLQQILENENPGVDLMVLNKEFEAANKITLLAVCEIWHQLRSKNTAVEAMILSFAQSMARKNKANTALSHTIHLQRLRLAILEKWAASHTSCCYERSEVSGQGPIGPSPEASEA